MPRIYDSTDEPLDFCRECFPTEEEAKEDFSSKGDGPDGRGNCFEWHADHPPYEEVDYKCNSCGRTLTERDNCLDFFDDQVKSLPLRTDSA